MSVDYFHKIIAIPASFNNDTILDISVEERLINFSELQLLP